jgi:hypothetical protein
MFDQNYVLQQLIPHRLHSVHLLNLVIRLRAQWDAPQPMKIYVAEKLLFTGNFSAFTNPAIEVGLIHCRALLEFLGLKADPRVHKKIVERNGKRADDWVIEDLIRPDGSPLTKVGRSDAVKRYPDVAEGEAALGSVIHIANRGLAHFTSALSMDATEARLTEIASRGVHALVESYVYTPLGLPFPSSMIEALPRDIDSSLGT